MRTRVDWTDSLSRRSWLGQAVGAVGTWAALGSTTRQKGKRSRRANSGAARVRDSFDFGWKFFKGDAPGAQQPIFRRRKLEKRGPAS